jgi:WD40 repeat protein
MLDGRPIAVSAGEDGTIRTWDLIARKPISVLVTGASRIEKISCITAPSGSSFAITKGFHSGSAEVWDLSRQKQMGRLDSAVNAIATTVLQGRAIAVISGGNGVVLWDIARRRRLGALSAEDDSIEELTCAIGRDKRPIAVGYGRAAIWTWDLDRQSRIGAPAALRGGIRTPDGLTCTSAGDRLVAISVHTEIDYEATRGGSLEIYIGEVRLWDLTKGKLIGEHRTSTGDYLRGVACMMYGGRPVALTGGDDRILRMWDLGGKKLIGKWPVHSSIESLSSSADGALVLGVGSDILIVDISQHGSPGVY